MSSYKGISGIVLNIQRAISGISKAITCKCDLDHECKESPFQPVNSYLIRIPLPVAPRNPGVERIVDDRVLRVHGRERHDVCYKQGC